MTELFYRAAMLTGSLIAFAVTSAVAFSMFLHDYCLSAIVGVSAGVCVWKLIGRRLDEYYQASDHPPERTYPVGFRDAFIELKELLQDHPFIDPATGVPRDWRIRCDHQKGTLVATVEFQENYNMSRRVMMFGQRWIFERCIRLLVTCTPGEQGTAVKLDWSIASRANRFVANQVIADIGQAIDRKLNTLSARL